MIGVVTTKFNVCTSAPVFYSTAKGGKACVTRYVFAATIVFAAPILIEGLLGRAYPDDWTIGQLTPSKRILVLYSYRHPMPVNLQWDRGIRKAIAETYPGPVAFDVEFLDGQRLDDATIQELWVELMRRKYKHSKPDLIIPVHDLAASLFLEHSQSLFPDVPIVFCSMSEGMYSTFPMADRMTGTLYRFDFRRTVEAAMELWPTARNVVVISGAGRIDSALRQEFQSKYPDPEKFSIEYWTGVPLPLLCDDVRRIGRDSIILFLVQDQDRDGILSVTSSDVVRRVSDAASVPVFGLYDTLLGNGIIGGCLASVEEHGFLAGQIAARILRGEQPSDIPFSGLDLNRYMFDHRQLLRWGISDHDLPENSLVLFREPSVWQQYGMYFMSVLTVIGLQALLITALLVNRVKRLRAESDVIDRLHFESLLSQVKSRFVCVPSDRLGAHMNDTLVQLVEFWGLSRGMVLGLAPDGLQLRVLGSVGHSEDFGGLEEISLDSLPWMWEKLSRDKVISFEGLSSLPEAAASDRQVLHRIGLSSGVLLLLETQGALLGLLAVGQSDSEYEWDGSIIRRLNLIGEVLTQALAQARVDEALAASEESARHLAGMLLTAHEDERRRLGREIHDDLSQRLAAVAIEMGNVSHYFEGDCRQHLLVRLRERLVDLADDAHGFARRLHPSILDDLGLVDAIRSECARISEQSGIAIDFRGGRLPEKIPNDVSLCIYRIAQEGLWNAVKHSQTARIVLTLIADAEQLHLDVRDFGCGFKRPPRCEERGLGIASMEERLQLVHGTVAIHSVPGEGTCVSVTVPLHLD